MRQKQIFIIAVLGAFLIPYTGSAVNVALPDMSRALGLTSTGMSWVQLSFLLAMAMFVLPIGRKADQIGRKKVLTFGTFGYLAVSLLCSLAGTGWQMILFRSLQGVFGAAVSVSVVAMVTSAFPPGERGKMLGLTSASTYTGLSVGPFLGGLLTDLLGWRSVFWTIVPACLLMGALLLRLEGEWRQEESGGFDYSGAAIYGLGLSGLIVGLSFITRPYGWMLLAGGVLCLLLFVRHQGRAPFPMLDLSLLSQNRLVLFSSLAALISYSATFSTGYLISLDLQLLQGFTSRAAGLVLIAQPVVQAFFSPIAGRVSDRMNPGTVASVGMGISVVGLALLATLPHGNTLAVTLVLALMGLGLALFVTPNTSAVMGAVEKKHYGAASGLLGTARSVGQAFSMGITTLVMALTVGTAKIGPEAADAFISAYRICFGLTAALCILGVFASLARNPKTRTGEAP